MPGIREIRRLPYSVEQMFDLVADVGRYGEFLPWVVGARIRSDSDVEMVADLLIGFKALREKFTSLVVKDRPHTITVQYIDGPMRDLENRWKFELTQDGGCEIHFAVDFTFKNRLFEKLAGQYFDRAFHKMMGAFEARADELYGSSNSNATSVA